MKTKSKTEWAEHYRYCARLWRDYEKEAARWAHREEDHAWSEQLEEKAKQLELEAVLENETDPNKTINHEG